MDKFIKKTAIIVVVTLLLLGAAALIGLKLYNYLIEDATNRIQSGVRSGVSGGIGDAVNPLNIPKRMFGGGN